ncbi:unnamed protein product [Rangifer tarandus platyrhynchus]|uniref:Uncharacterized protein n=1 Tax=Rangifer tarandus platyrhynchus TaxID=3082113 RepID=A0AC60A2G7_RANTA
MKASRQAFHPATGQVSADAWSPARCHSAAASPTSPGITQASSAAASRARPKACLRLGHAAWLYGVSSALTAPAAGVCDLVELVLYPLSLCLGFCRI